MKSTYNEYESKMSKAIDHLKHEYDHIRAGRANPSILEDIKVEYYGSPTPINQIGNVSVPEPRMLVIQPWDGSILKEVEKAIQKSDIGINPSNDGKVIRLSFPQPTEERRMELKKDVHKKGEEAKVAIRNIRRDALHEFKEMEKKSEITKDDLTDVENDIQKLTDKFIADIDSIIKLKDDEIMEV